MTCYRLLDPWPKGRRRVKVGSDTEGFRSWDMIVEEHSIESAEGGGLLISNRPSLAPEVSRFQAAQVFGLSAGMSLPQEDFRDSIAVRIGLRTRFRTWSGLVCVHQGM